MTENQTSNANPILFAIHIVESPSAKDFFAAREEGAALEESLHLMRVSSERYRVISEDFLVKAAEKIAAHHGPGGTYEGYVPIVHISCHGNDTGIGLTTGDAIPWNRLGEILKPINTACGGALLLGMSTCKGYNAFRMAWTLGDTPYFLVVGPTHDVDWRDSLVGFTVLYHRFTKALPASRPELEQMIDTVNDATGLPRGTFAYAVAEEVKKGFTDFVVNWKRKKQAEASQALVAALRSRAKKPPVTTP